MRFQENKLEVSYQSVVILRILLSFIFMVAGFSHLLNTEKTVNRIEDQGIELVKNILIYPEIAVLLSGIFMLISGICLLVGYRTSLTAVVLIALLISITITIQLGQLSTLGPLFKNIAILGGLLFFSINSNLKIQKT